MVCRSRARADQPESEGHFSAEVGALRCALPIYRAGISLEAVKLLKAYQRLDIEAIATLRLAAAVERETEAALREFVRVALERDARSLAFLDEVRGAPVIS